MVNDRETGDGGKCYVVSRTYVFSFLISYIEMQGIR